MSIRLSMRPHNDDPELFVIELHESQLPQLGEPIDYQAIRYDQTAVSAVNEIQLMLARNKRKI